MDLVGRTYVYLWYVAWQFICGLLCRLPNDHLKNLIIMPFCLFSVNSLLINLGTCELAVCVRIEPRIESGITIRIESRVESAICTAQH